MRVLIVTNMYPTPAQPAFGTFVRDQVDALERAGVEIDVLFVNGRQRTLNYLGGAFRLWWKLLHKRYEVIHAHYAISGFLARLQCLYPVVVTYHGSELSDYVPSWLRVPARRGPWLFDRIIVVNQRQKDLILGNSEKVNVIPCGIDFDFFRPSSLVAARTQLDLPQDKPLVLWVGDCHRYEKHFELADAAMKLLKRHCPDAELVLVADKPHSIMPVYMNACDVLLLTSRSEGSPMVIKEAMACNLPIVSTAVGDVPEVIAGVAGCYLVDPEAEDVADKLERVVRQGQRTKGREKIQYLDSVSITSRIIDVYRELS